jgi:monoterpene epsilon-lactone hydrolase
MRRCAADKYGDGMPSMQSRFLRFFIRRFNFLNPKDAPLSEVRRKTDASARLLRPPRSVSVQRISAGSVPAEWLIPAAAPEDRALLYFHGGAFIYCSLATHRAMVARLASAGGTRALSVDYRLAPEHPFPAALEDCLAAYRWLLNSGISPRRIVVGGDSAGGNLALGLLLALRKAGDPLPAAAVCLSPVTDLAWTGESFRAKAEIDPVFPKRTSRSISANIESGYIGSEDPRNPLISPLYGDWRGMPPVLFHVGEDEVLLDDSARLADRVRGAGGQAEVVVWPRMWHVFQVFAPFLPEADQSIKQIGAFIRRMQGQ